MHWRKLIAHALSSFSHLFRFGGTVFRGQTPRLSVSPAKSFFQFATLVITFVGLVNIGFAVELNSLQRLSSTPSAFEIQNAGVFENPLVPVGQPSPLDNQVLLKSLNDFSHRLVRDDFSNLSLFLEQNPRSPWSPALETQLGAEYYRVGRYSKAIATWEHVWKTARATNDETELLVANRAASELAMMYSRLGRMTELRSLLGEFEGRDLRGMVPRHLRGARDGLWSMEHQPEVSFRCGPLALDRICAATDRKKAGNQLIQDSQSTTNGFSARQVAALARQLGMNYQVAFRQRGAQIIFPAVVHWNVGHYAALIARDGNLIRADDPTFGNKTWLSDEALDDEASGYFLVRSGPLPAGWRIVPDGEADQVWGKGTTLKSDPDCTTPFDQTTACPGGSSGMVTWSIHLLLASQHLTDTPLSYIPPVGPPINFTVTYNSANAGLAYVPYASLAPDWGVDWLQYVIDDPSNPFGDVKFDAGGGSLTFTDFDSTNQVFQNQFRNRANMVRTSTNSYEVRFPDGSKKVFDLPGGSIGTTRRIFMTAAVDAAGNAVTIQYDFPGRISSITDAIGQKTKLYYESTYTNFAIIPPNQVITNIYTNIYIVSRVVDPFGRTALFQSITYSYDGSYTYLTNIVDTLGLSSGFSASTTNFGTAGYSFMGVLTTPYGTTQFAPGSYNGLYRANWMEIIHPNGERERVEYSEKNAGVVTTEPLAIVPKGVPVRNFLLRARNTYYWDRKAYAEGYSPNDYTHARIYHWTHELDYTTASPILESYKDPLEHRVWYSYPGQYSSTFAGTGDQPVSVARTLEDGTTQIYKFEYNSLNNLTKAVDPIGRTLSYIYNANDVDVAEVRQTKNGQNELLSSATYNSQHLPLTITDAAGQTSHFTYNSRGQVLTATNPRGDTTSYSYDLNGYLLAIDGPLAGTSDTSHFTYDSFGRLRTVADPDGYTLTYDYDVMDRLTKITYPDSTYEQITYHLLDPEILRDRAGKETHLIFDSDRQLISQQDPLGRVTHYEWCGCGKLSSIIDPMGRAISWIRDFQGRTTARVYADGSMVQYGYDTATGWLKSVRDEQNQVTTYDYNIDGTLRKKSYINALISTAPVSFTYDPNYRRVATMQDGTGLTTYSYYPINGGSTPGAGRISLISGPLPNVSTTFTYDELGREATRGINGATVRRTWDAAGRLTQLTNVLGSFNYAWEGASRRLSSIDFPNGQHSSFAYFPNLKDQLLRQITHLKPDTTLLSRFTYDYNALSQVTQITQEHSGINPIQWTFDYDDDEQLTNAVAMQNAALVENDLYAFDAAGNRTDENGLTASKKTYYNALNEPMAIASASAQPASYEWDAEGRVVAFNQATHRTEFTYDGFGRRTRIVEKENNIVLTNRSYVWCQGDLCEELDGVTGNVLKRYSIHGVRVENGADVPSGNYLITRDRLQSVRDLTDSTGAVRAAYNYSPYGQINRFAGDLDSDFGFTGLYTHRPSRLNLAMYRAYDPSLGRWISRDPTGENDGLNLYRYARNDPINFVDPFGLQTAASGLTSNLQGSKDAQAGVDAYNQAQKVVNSAEKIAEKGVKEFAKDTLKDKGEEAIKEIAPRAEKEAEDLNKKAGERADDSVNPYFKKLSEAFGIAGDALQGNGSGSPCTPKPTPAPPTPQEKSIIDRISDFLSGPADVPPAPTPIPKTKASIGPAKVSIY